MRAADWLIEAGKVLIEFGDHLKMQVARVDSLNARAEPPKETSELTGVIRDAIVAARAESEDEDWLRLGGRRDQECVRYGITRDQAAGILASVTKREKRNGNGNGHTHVVSSVEKPEAIETLASAPQKSGAKNYRNMFDSKEWGEIQLEKGGDRDQVPERMVRVADTQDKSIVILVYKLCMEHKKDWSELRDQLSCVRRLTRQQVAGIVAVHNRNKKTLAPTAQA